MAVLRCSRVLALFSACAFATSAQLICTTSESQPNPIANQYPNDATGTINGTTAIIPIPYATARSIVPAQYGILTHAYQSLIPNLPPGTFPAFLEAVLDHDVGMGSTKIGDFQRIAISLPFVDRLNDGYSSFKYKLPQLISDNPVALAGSSFYGITYLGIFDPACNPYKGNGRGTTYQAVYAAPGGPAITKPAFNSTFTAVSSIPYSIEIFENVTNQPVFGDVAPTCDNYITLYNSSVTTGSNAPKPVQGTLSVATPFYPSDAVFTNVYGYRMDNAFVERNNKPCESLKGYSGTGSGD